MSYSEMKYFYCSLSHHNSQHNLFNGESLKKVAWHNGSCLFQMYSHNIVIAESFFCLDLSKRLNSLSGGVMFCPFQHEKMINSALVYTSCWCWCKKKVLMCSVYKISAGSINLESVLIALHKHYYHVRSKT